MGHRITRTDTKIGATCSVPLHEDALVSVESLPGFDHVNSWIQAMPRAAEWFRHL